LYKFQLRDNRHSSGKWDNTEGFVIIVTHAIPANAGMPIDLLLAERKENRMSVPHASPSAKIKSPNPGELTPRDDIKKQVSEVLKRVDQLIRHGDLKIAQDELVKAKQLDPKNVYAMAFEERIENLLVQETESKLAQEARRAGEEEAKRHYEEEQRKAEEARERLRKEATQLVNQAQVTPVDREQIVRTLTQEQARQQATAEVPKSEPSTQVGSHDDDLRIYRDYLDQIWADGIPTSEERKQMDLLRSAMNISADEHARLDEAARLAAYEKALHRAVLGTRTAPSAAAHLELRKVFHVSDAEHAQIETRLLGEFRKTRKKPSIVIIDDDVRLLELLAQAIGDAGFEVMAVPTSDEAYALMRKHRPDLILCDINLETSTMGGFSFYEKVQEVPHLQDVPFVFLTGLTDEVLVRAGKELGVDDYLMKPISQQLLISTLKGKLKRYRQLRTVAPATVAA